MTHNSPHAFQGVMSSKNSVELSTRYPSSQDATKLWHYFRQRVQPVARISFDAELKRLETVSFDSESRKQLSDAEHAFVFSLYLISVVSLSDEDCKRELHQSKSWLVLEYQLLCEEALSRTNLFCMTDIIVIKALTVYMVTAILPTVYTTPS